jgi:uncharacterized membrane protein YbhN (UPF0104 family)
MSQTVSQQPRWVGIPVRVVLTTVVVTLLAFAVGLLLSILGTVVYSQVKHVAPNMPYAYRYIAFPFAITVGVTVLALSLSMEIRHYRQRKTLARIERAG